MQSTLKHELISGTADSLKKLLKSGKVNVNEFIEFDNNDKCSALEFVISADKLWLVPMLLEYGADPNIYVHNKFGKVLTTSKLEYTESIAILSYCLNKHNLVELDVLFGDEHWRNNSPEMLESNGSAFRYLCSLMLDSFSLTLMASQKMHLEDVFNQIVKLGCKQEKKIEMFSILKEMYDISFFQINEFDSVLKDQQLKGIEQVYNGCNEVIKKEQSFAEQVFIASKGDDYNFSI